MRVLSNKLAEGLPDAHVVWCPACKILHKFYVNSFGLNKARWTWNGDINRPTFSPSLIITISSGDKNKSDIRCHSFLKNGIWEYLNDCTHEMAGKKVPLPDLPDWVLKHHRVNSDA